MSALSRKELESLLKHGAYGAFDSGGEVSIDQESIEQILSRSATILHDSDGNMSKPVSLATSFSKASFVSSASSDKHNTVSIDDPDFWSKVVGLALKDKSEQADRKRRCREITNSYKEPSMSIKETLSRLKDESDDSDSENEMKGKLGKDRRISAEFTQQNLGALLGAMMSKGYCNWEELKRDSKLKWTFSEIVSNSMLPVKFSFFVLYILSFYYL